MAFDIKTLTTRTITAVFFSAILLSCIVFSFITFSVLFLVVSVWGLHEFYKLLFFLFLLLRYLMIVKPLF